MSKPRDTASRPDGDPLPELVRRLIQAEEDLEKSVAGHIDSVVGPDGTRILLRQAQEKLQLSELQQREQTFMQVRIIDALPAHIALLDEHGVVLSVNEAWRRFASANRLAGSDFGVGRNYLDVCDRAEGACSEEATRVARGIRAVLSGEEPHFSTEYPCHSPDEQRWFRLMVTPLSDRGTGGVVVMHVNITERKLAEQELARSNRALRMLSACNEALIRATDERELLGEICRLIVETGGCRMAWVGYAEDDLEKTIRPQAHAGFEDGYLSKIVLSWSVDPPSGHGPAARALREGRAVACADIARESATFRWVEDAITRGYRSVVCLPLRTDDRAFGLLALYLGEAGEQSEVEIRLLQNLADNLSFGIAGIRTRAERQHAGAKLREQASLLDNCRDAIWVRGLDFRVTYWNQGAERLYGWTAEEAVGRPIAELVYGGRESDFKTVNALILKTGDWSGEVHHVSRDGRKLIVDGRASLILDDAGHPRGVFSINTDITERKRIESQFLRSQRMESIGTLAGGIAHDLNNLLAPILMSIGLLRMGVRDPEERGILDTIEASAKRGAGLIRQVLSFARGVEGNKVSTHPADLIGEIEHIIRDTFPKSIRLVVDMPADVRTIACDQTQMHQVLLNLSVNARDAMPTGGTLTISAENVTLDEQYVMVNRAGQPGPHVMFRVSDTGEGIAPEIRERVFDPFFTTKEPGQGTGLGLSTVATIIKSHDGFIQFYSEPERGTTFKIYLSAESSAGAVPTPAVPAELPRGHGETVLVVDDEQPVRAVTAQTLQAFGYEVLMAENGADAVVLYARRSAEIAVVLTDMMMPIMDGPTTIRALMKINPKVRIIGASGLSEGGSALKALGASQQHFLLKPYTADTLIRTVHQALTEAP